MGSGVRNTARKIMFPAMQSSLPTEKMVPILDISTSDRRQILRDMMGSDGCVLFDGKKYAQLSSLKHFISVEIYKRPYGDQEKAHPALAITALFGRVVT